MAPLQKQKEIHAKRQHWKRSQKLGYEHFAEQWHRVSTFKDRMSGLKRTLGANGSMGRIHVRTKKGAIGFSSRKREVQRPVAALPSEQRRRHNPSSPTPRRRGNPSQQAEGNPLHEETPRSYERDTKSPAEPSFTLAQQRFIHSNLAVDMQGLVSVLKARSKMRAKAFCLF